MMLRVRDSEPWTREAMVFLRVDILVMYSSTERMAALQTHNLVCQKISLEASHDVYSQPTFSLDLREEVAGVRNF